MVIVQGELPQKNENVVVELGGYDGLCMYCMYSVWPQLSSTAYSYGIAER